jgi:hypothetical protein
LRSRFHVGGLTEDWSVIDVFLLEDVFIFLDVESSCGLGESASTVGWSTFCGKAAAGTEFVTSNAPNAEPSNMATPFLKVNPITSECTRRRAPRKMQAALLA